MFRLFLIFNLLLLNIYACKGGYNSCKAKIKDSKTIKGCALEIPVKKHQRIFYSLTPPKAKIIKHDPFLNIYLIEDTKGFKYPFDINMKQQLGFASVSQSSVVEGKIVKRQVGLNSLAVFGEPIFYPSILTSSCCSLEGLVTPDGIIEKAYLKHFINFKGNQYSDIGIRVEDENSLVVVNAIDPFLKDNPFKKDDCIVAFNSQEIYNSAQLMRKILFSKLGSSQKVRVKRGQKFINFSVKSYKRYGGGLLSDTFLEQKGIYFDDKLHIIKLGKEFKDYGLNVGDKLLQVNAHNVKNQRELKAYIVQKKDFSSLLLQRDSFQFFVKIN